MEGLLVRVNDGRDGESLMFDYFSSFQKPLPRKGMGQRHCSELRVCHQEWQF